MQTGDIANTVIGYGTGGFYGGAIGAGYNSLFGGSKHRGPSANTRRGVRYGAYNQEQVRLDQEKEAERQRREGALSTLDAAYNDPNRTSGQENFYKTNLNNSLAGLNYGYGQASQKTGLAAARRGRLGSSTDMEQQAGLRNDLQQNIQNAESNSYSGLQSLRDTDANQHQALRRAIMAGDPQSAAMYQQQAMSYGDQSRNIMENARMQEQARQEREQEMRRTYQTIGNIANSAGQGVNNYYQYGRGY